MNVIVQADHIIPEEMAKIQNQVESRTVKTEMITNETTYSITSKISTTPFFIRVDSRLPSWFLHLPGCWNRMISASHRSTIFARSSGGKANTVSMICVVSRTMISVRRIAFTASIKVSSSPHTTEVLVRTPAGCL